MLGWRIGVGVLAVSAVAACAAPAPEKPTPPEHASCMASLPDGWRTAFDDGARTVAPAEVPLAVGPAGDVVVARDDGTVRDAALIGECVADRPGAVVLDTGFGRRLLGEAEGELLPRIC